MLKVQPKLFKYALFTKVSSQGIVEEGMNAGFDTLLPDHLHLKRTMSLQTLPPWTMCAISVWKNPLHMVY
jgi:hypothetical protein